MSCWPPYPARDLYPQWRRNRSGRSGFGCYTFQPGNQYSKPAISYLYSDPPPPPQPTSWYIHAHQSLPFILQSLDLPLHGLMLIMYTYIPLQTSLLLLKKKIDIPSVFFFFTTCFGSHETHQWRIQRGFNWFHGTPLLKGYLRKYYAQTYYVHYAHTRTTHFSFKVATMHDLPLCQLNNFLYQEFDACMTYVHVYTTRSTWQPQRQWAKRESELKQRFYSCIAPSAARDGDMRSRFVLGAG